jgi:hypothetical protein
MAGMIVGEPRLGGDSVDSEAGGTKNRCVLPASHPGRREARRLARGRDAFRDLPRLPNLRVFQEPPWLS